MTDQSLREKLGKILDVVHDEYLTDMVGIKSNEYISVINATDAIIALFKEEGWVQVADNPHGIRHVHVVDNIQPETREERMKRVSDMWDDL